MAEAQRAPVALRDLRRRSVPGRQLVMPLAARMLDRRVPRILPVYKIYVMKLVFDNQIVGFREQLLGFKPLAIQNEHLLTKDEEPWKPCGPSTPSRREGNLF